MDGIFGSKMDVAQLEGIAPASTIWELDAEGAGRRCNGNIPEFMVVP
jgi:hypothetical protein